MKNKLIYTVAYALLDKNNDEFDDCVGEEIKGYTPIDELYFTNIHHAFIFIQQLIREFQQSNEIDNADGAYIELYVDNISDLGLLESDIEQINKNGTCDNEISKNKLIQTILIENYKEQ